VDNRIDGAVLALLDTDEERRSETNMQDAQEYLSIILEVVQDGFVELDAEYRIVRFNSAFCRLLQASESDFPGRAIWEVGRGAWKNDALRQVLESNRLSHPPSCEIDAEFQTDGGELRRFRIQTRWMSANEQRAKRVVLVFTPMFDGSPEKLGHSAA
jgi:two-component system CheB/CheR fusion protein